MDSKSVSEATPDTAGQSPQGSGESADSRGRVRAVQTRWYSVAEAARLLQISEVAVRKRLATGSLTGVRAGRSWRVLLTGDPERLHGTPEQVEASAPAPGPEVQALVQVSQSLEVVLRDLQRQNLALAGQIGYLQSQLHTAHEELEELRRGKSKVKQLQAPEESEAIEEVAVAPPSRETVEVAATVPEPEPAPEPASAQLTPEAAPPARRRWWRRLF